MKLVFIKSSNLNEEPFTTSRIIAEYGGQQHKNIRELIENHERDIKEFGRVTFETIPLAINDDEVYTFETDKPKISKGGRPEKIYKLNEQQATFLITLMKNTRKVIGFKKALVKQFYEMREELTKRRIERAQGKQYRNALTEAIDKLPESKHKNMLHKHYTDLAYKLTFGKNTKQLRIELEIGDKETPRDYLPSKDVDKFAVEHIIQVLANNRAFTNYRGGKLEWRTQNEKYLIV